MVMYLPMDDRALRQVFYLHLLRLLLSALPLVLEVLLVGTRKFVAVMILRKVPFVVPTVGSGGFWRRRLVWMNLHLVPWPY